MDEKLKADWVAALRSGKYEQGKGALRSAGNKFCCIGVLCDLVDGNAWLPAQDTEAMSWRDPETFGNLPGKVAMELGVELHIELLPTLNDSGSTFAEIANVIELGDIKGSFERITGRSAD